MSAASTGGCGWEGSQPANEDEAANLVVGGPISHSESRLEIPFCLLSPLVSLVPKDSFTNPSSTERCIAPQNQPYPSPRHRLRRRPISGKERSPSGYHRNALAHLPPFSTACSLFPSTPVRHHCPVLARSSHTDTHILSGFVCLCVCVWPSKPISVVAQPTLPSPSGCAPSHLVRAYCLWKRTSTISARCLASPRAFEPLVAMEMRTEREDMARAAWGRACLLAK